MAPDEIEYVIKTAQGDKIEKSDSLLVLTKLYGCATFEVPSDEYPTSQSYTVVEAEEGEKIKLGRWDMNDSITTTYAELQATLEPLLSDIFTELDKKNGREKRREAIDYMNANSGLDFEELYKRLSE